MKDREARLQIELLQDRLKITEDTFRQYMRTNGEMISVMTDKIRDQNETLDRLIRKQARLNEMLAERTITPQHNHE